MFEKEKQDIMDAEALVSELEKLIESEKSEGEAGNESDVRELEEALAHLNAFIAAENKEIVVEKPVEMVDVSDPKSVVDTSVLTGPIGGLKNFLIKKQRSNEAK